MVCVQGGPVSTDGVIHCLCFFYFQKPSLRKKKKKTKENKSGGEDFAERFLGNELAHGNAWQVPAELVAQTVERGGSVVAPFGPAHHL